MNDASDVDQSSSVALAEDDFQETPILGFLTHILRLVTQEEDDEDEPALKLSLLMASLDGRSGRLEAPFDPESMSDFERMRQLGWIRWRPVEPAGASAKVFELTEDGQAIWQQFSERLDRLERELEESGAAIASPLNHMARTLRRYLEDQADRSRDP